MAFQLIDRACSTVAFFARSVFAYALQEPYECAGAVFGGLGAWLLSQNAVYSKWGWVAFLASNFCFLAMAHRKRLFGMVAVQCYFAYTSLNGIEHYF